MARPRKELEQFTQNLERANPDWTARQVERELEALSPVVYGHWKDETPSLEARLRQVQRWRKGFRSPPRPPAPSLYRHMWPVGERQRQELDPTYVARPTRARASHRLFLYNCTAEPIREVHVKLAGKAAAYEPVIASGRFAEIDWYKDEAIHRDLTSAQDHVRLRYPLTVQFAVDKGRRSGRLEGELVLDASDGWVAFTAHDGSGRDLE